MAAFLVTQLLHLLGVACNWALGTHRSGTYLCIAVWLDRDAVPFLRTQLPRCPTGRERPRAVWSGPRAPARSAVQRVVFSVTETIGTMEGNSYKTDKKNTLFGQIERRFRLGSPKLHGPSGHAYLLRLLFLLVLGLLYIWNVHFHEHRLHQINQLRPLVADLRVKYMELQSSYMFASKQSEVAKRVAPMGLCESKVPPYTIQSEEPS